MAVCRRYCFITFDAVFVFQILCSPLLISLCAPLWPPEDSHIHRIPAVRPGYGPFESSDDSFYRNIGFIQVVIAKGDERKQQLLQVGLKLSNKGTTSNALLQKMFHQDFVPHAPMNMATSPTSPKQTVTDAELTQQLRDYLAQVRVSAEKALKSVVRLSQQSNDSLLAAYDQVFTEDIATLLTGDQDSRGVVKEMQDALCPALEQEDRELHNWMMEQVLDSVSHILGEPVNLEDINRMHSIIGFVERYQGDVESAGGNTPVMNPFASGDEGDEFEANFRHG